MGLIRIARDGVSRIINLEFLISAELDETTKTVVLRLIEGETISISGKDADRVWTALMLEAEPEPDEDDETEEDETTVDLESINLEISELEDRLQSASAIRFYEGQRLRDSAKCWAGIGLQRSGNSPNRLRQPGEEPMRWLMKQKGLRFRRTSRIA